MNQKTKQDLFQEMTNHNVRLALARHLGMRASDISIAHHLERDLTLEPLDLVLVVLQLEAIHHDEFPLAELDRVATVADLIELYRAWLTRLAEPPPSSRDFTASYNR